MITESEYLKAKAIVEEYEAQDHECVFHLPENCTVPTISLTGFPTYQIIIEV